MLERLKPFIEKYPTPFFLFDLERIRSNFSRLTQAFATDALYYAVKANNHPIVLSTLRSINAKFETSSYQEISTLSQLQVPPANLIYSHPVKSPESISSAYMVGVDTFALDSQTELEKLAKLAPSSKVLVRIYVSNEGSLFPLNQKFGASSEEAVELIRRAEEAGLKPLGLAFHVGSQCERLATWAEAMSVALEVWQASPVPLACLNIGGGFPAPYREGTLAVEDIAKVVQACLRGFPGSPKLMLEPGRFLVASAGVLVASVIGRATREGREWLYLDVGALHGLFEALQAERRFPYTVYAEKGGVKREYVLSGQTCDPDDTILESVWLPELGVGDKVVISNVGAYSLVYASEFNGFYPPKVYFTVEGSKHESRRANKEPSQAY